VAPLKACRHGGMELSGPDEAIDGAPAVVEDIGEGWCPSSRQLGWWRCQTGSPHLGVP
jgi:hypothetical protein